MEEEKEEGTPNTRRRTVQQCDGEKEIASWYRETEGKRVGESERKRKGKGKSTGDTRRKRWRGEKDRGRDGTEGRRHDCLLESASELERLAAGGEGEVEYGPTAAGHGAAAGAEGTGLGIRVTLRLDAPSTSTQNDGVARRGAT